MPARLVTTMFSNFTVRGIVVSLFSFSSENSGTLDITSNSPSSKEENDDGEGEGEGDGDNPISRVLLNVDDDVLEVIVVVVCEDVVVEVYETEEDVVDVFVSELELVVDDDEDDVVVDVGRGHRMSVLLRPRSFNIGPIHICACSCGCGWLYTNVMTTAVNAARINPLPMMTLLRNNFFSLLNTFILCNYKSKEGSFIVFFLCL
eukprot:m.31604 g.31604  ORF g.31604 m.31604 type:complete len:204 (+) comp8331_c0_seq1:1924-2535(+)